MKKASKADAVRNALDRDTGSDQSHSGLMDRLMGTGAVVQRDFTKALKDAAREIDLDHIKPDPKQPRKTFHQDSLLGLAESITANGVLQPVAVTWSEDQEAYILISGHRRFEASKLAGRSSIPAIIKPADYDEDHRLQEQLAENLQREDLPVIEEAAGIQLFMDLNKLSQRDAAKRLGKPLTYVAEAVGILRIPEELLQKGKALPKRALVEISRSKNTTEQAALLDQALQTDTPFQQVKKKRDQDRAPRKETFRQTYRAEGIDGKVSVSFDRAPDDVNPEEVVEFLGKVMQTIVAEQARK